MPQSSFMLNKHLSKWLNLRCDIKVSSHLRVLAPTIKFILHWFTVHSYDYTHCGCTLLETKDINWTISMAPMNIIPVVTIFFSKIHFWFIFWWLNLYIPDVTIYCSILFLSLSLVHQHHPLPSSVRFIHWCAMNMKCIQYLPIDGFEWLMSLWLDNWKIIEKKRTFSEGEKLGKNE